MGYNEDRDRFKPATDTDKLDYDTDGIDVFEGVPNASEAVVGNCAKGNVIKNDGLVVDISTAEDDMVNVAELTVEE